MRNSQVVAWCLPAILALGVSSCALPGSENAPPKDLAGSVVVSDAWIRATPPGATAGAAYLTLRSSRGDRLVGVEVPSAVARAAELHQTVTGPGGQLTMKPMASVELPAGVDVEFKPGGSHIMLAGLARPLAAGETVELKLRLQKAPEKKLAVVVRNEQD